MERPQDTSAFAKIAVNTGLEHNLSISTEEHSSQLGFTESHRRRLPNVVTSFVGAVVIGASGFAAWKLLNKSGEYQHFQPTVAEKAPVDNVERIISWNMEGQTDERIDQLHVLVKNADVVMLQEVSTADAKILHKDFPAWHIVYALADQKQHWTQGGYGDVQMSRQDPKNIETRSIAGTSLTDTAVRTVAGLPSDVVNLNPNLDSTKAGWQEQRVVEAETTKVRNSGKLIDIRTINVHISGNNSVHTRQLDDAMDFVKGNWKSDEPMVVCGDFNGGAASITSDFVDSRMVTPAKEGEFSGYNGDFCAYNMAGHLSLARVKVSSEFFTDHYPLKFSWKLR
ncbi:MAG TPA: endonuclease/exonuclease/phosphatase family protein [Candidatus Saccharimonadales bacterium]|nr:endonuclease/exonuclease/phosphatase family protein [Candidatus Saccharimonadales bacterium]